MSDGAKLVVYKLRIRQINVIFHIQVLNSKMYRVIGKIMLTKYCRLLLNWNIFHKNILSWCKFENIVEMQTLMSKIP